MEYIRDSQLTRACRTQMNKNLKATGKSLTATSIAGHVNDYILEIQSDSGREPILVMRSGWRDKIKTL